MNPAKKIALHTQKFVNDHKVGLAATASAVTTAGVCLKAHHTVVKQFNEFLDEHGLKEAFYNKTL